MIFDKIFFLPVFHYHTIHIFIAHLNHGKIDTVYVLD